MKNILKYTISIILYLSITNTLNAQCNYFIEKDCKHLLKPYLYNGQVNTTLLSEGDFAELVITFYSNQKYRIVVCGEENLKNITFTLSDLNGNTFFSNADYNFINHWDFSSKTTKQLRVEVSVPKQNTSETQQGCVAILVGFMGK